MLYAHANTPTKDFIAQLRTYVIAMNLSPMVVDCVDNLVGADELESEHEAELENVESQGENRGRKSMKKEILKKNNKLAKEPTELRSDRSPMRSAA